MSHKKYQRIWIFGGTGSGKTTFAKQLSKEMKIPFYSTDEMVYSKGFEKMNSERMRNEKLKEISSEKKWIIEGVHASDWILPSFEKVQLVLILEASTLVRLVRVIKRELFE